MRMRLGPFGHMLFELVNKGLGPMGGWVVGHHSDPKVVTGIRIVQGVEASRVHILQASAETSMASSRRPLLCVINSAGEMSSATAMAGSHNVPLVSLVCHHLVGLCDSPHILSLKSPIRMSTLLKVPSHLPMARCCAFLRGPCMLMITKGGMSSSASRMATPDPSLPG